MSENEHITRVLQASTPFETLPASLLASIAAIGRPAHFRAGETIYEVGSPAETIYLILRGQVEHSFDPGIAAASQLVKIVGPGAVFGWAALLKTPVGAAPPHRLARTVSVGDSDVLVLDALELVAVLDTLPGAKQGVMGRFASMVRHLYGFAGFVKVGDKLVPAAISSSESGSPRDYDTFGF